MRPLDPLAIGLQGLKLIEASAGTGKTYTIGTLYLRLLLESGLDVDQVLVVTFTQAATEELRERIRRRVAQALAVLEGAAAAAAGDPVLAGLLRRLPDPTRARATLADALTRMDEAAVYTIHGFCQRVLQEHAFESGTAFDTELITEERPLRQEAVEDIWRRRVSAAEVEEAAWVCERWAGPGDLLEAILAGLGQDHLRVLPERGAEALEEGRELLSRLLAALRTTWAEDRTEVEEILRDSPALNRNSYRRNIVERALTAMDEWLARGEALSGLPADFARFTNTTLAQQTKAGKTPPAHPFFDLCSEAARAVPLLESRRRAAYLAEAREFVRRTLERRKQERRQLYFDDLLRNLDRALAGAGGERLGAAIRGRYPVAMIDEFQDTDPLQYRIFQAVYRGHPECGLLLIGDPKQAIYAFRGADIFTYVLARRDTSDDGQHTLGTNWRSSSRLVRAVNALFGQAARPFVYDDFIGFEPVEPGPAADARPLLVDGVEPVPLEFWVLPVDEDNQTSRPPGFIRQLAARESAAGACAERIAMLLNLADAGRVTLGGVGLRPRDIAVLVRTHGEGDLCQGALRRCGVSSVTLSQQSVFETEDAAALAGLLDAVAEPGDDGVVRAALASDLLGWDAAALDRLSGDEAAWEALLERFQEYRRLWLERGLMVTFQRLLDGEDISRRLLARPDGERRLTNLLQLAELLQVVSRERPGLEETLRWLADQRAGEQRDEARQLRLESDEALVKIVTMHKSKGLEYPVVFIPFPWSHWRDRSGTGPVLFHDPADRSLCLDLGSEAIADHRALQRTEALAERLRLLYVAVTRAASLCVLCWGKIHQAEGSAPAYLLHQELGAGKEAPGSRMRGLTEREIRADLEALAAHAPGCVAVNPLPESTGARWSGADGAPDGLSLPVWGGRIDAGWRVSSYSGLVRGEETERPDYDLTARAETGLEGTAPEQVDPVFRVPAGADVGHCLHGILEAVDFPAARGADLEQTVREHLARYPDLGAAADAVPPLDWTPAVLALIGQTLDTVLDRDQCLRLRDVTRGECIRELEFHYSMARLEPQALGAALEPFGDYAPAAQGLEFDPRRGLMRGFIDLVVRRDSRYYLVDYKSNHLGNRLEDYAGDRLRLAMGSHRYDLQSLVYTVALHRFLGRRLAGYDYERHFGGAYYLFLRGMRPQHGPRYGVHFDRPGQALVERLDALFGMSGGAA